MVSHMHTKDHAIAAFEAQFGRAPSAIIFAPGRVNLIGEHTDYNDGFVLPMAIQYGTYLAIAPRDDSQLCAVAADFDGQVDSFALDDAIVPNPHISWSAHIRGIAHSYRQRGLAMSGINIAIAGDVPAGAGLSSSASLGVGLSLALAHVSGQNTLTATDHALIAQQSENEFVGTACGIMDQLVSARAEKGTALMIDCRSLATTPVAMPHDLSVLIVHSGVERELADSAYNERRAQCESVAKAMHVPALRDVNIDQLEAAQNTIPSIAFRRARHVVTENARTLAAAQAFKDGNHQRLGELMGQSHLSMRDDFEITTPKVDALVALLQQAIGNQGGARMTGGGFGGCVVASMPQSLLPGIMQHVATHYQTPKGDKPLMIAATPSDGAALLS